MSDEEQDVPSARLPSTPRCNRSDQSPSRKRISFSSLTHSLHETISRRNLSAPAAPDSPRSDPFPPRARNSLFFSRSRRSLDDRRHMNIRRNSPRTSAAVLARSILGRSSTPTSSSIRSSSDFDTVSAAASVRHSENRRVNYRRYSVGEICLVECQHSRLAQLVNRYGFPPGGGFTPEEQRGPYNYVLATVKKRHFEEDAEYYTVTRFDTAADQRADAEWMVPIRRGSKGEVAAREAATEHRRDSAADGNGRLNRRGSVHRSSDLNDSKVVQGMEVCLSFLLTPFLWLYEICLFFFRFSKQQAKHFLYGEKPYKLSVRITAVNVVVFCNTWVMFIDQLRLAFFPPSADFALAIVSCILWFILVLELLFELFIRPDDYKQIIVSERAYDPGTVRYINCFHLSVECVALFAFIPEFACLFTNNFTCGDRPSFSFFNAARISVLGPDRLETFYGRAFFALVRLRVFGLVRHWKKMWTTKTFVNMKSEETGVFMPARISLKRDHRQKEKESTTMENDDQKQKDAALVNASHIGTALMVVNSHRAMTVFWFIFGLFPLLFCFASRGGANANSFEMVGLLEATNVEFSTVGNNESCVQFVRTVLSWAVGVTTGNAPQIHSNNDIYLLYLEIAPTGRCPELYPNFTGIVTQQACRIFETEFGPLEGRIEEICDIWGTTESTTDEALAGRAGIRPGAITTEVVSQLGNLTYPNGTVDEVEYRIEAKFNNTFSVEPAAFGSFLLQLSLLIYILGFLSILRRDARVLVLGPLRRMLKIVAQYAKNPLATIKRSSSKNSNDDTETEDEDSSSSDEDDMSQENDLGSFETEQLINAVSKITDLLRKCWGVAGAGIISTNLARQEVSLTEVFNPTVPGTSVYALFGFCAVNAFDHYLRALGGDVMILINDVASVLHSEVFRWGLGDSGQCNKNLGSAWLMVFRIGDVETVVKKLDEATNVVFSNRQKTIRKRNKKGARKSKARRRSGSRERTKRSKSANAMSLSLAQLPGISVFTDRALIGILKTFAGIYRDEKLLSWKKDFRLGAGVGAFSVNMIFGLDAGWAMEGAVGSEYKIDATYLSPHVNMASRMMSACKQYGVSILLSQAVQELLSDVARSKLRHLDTVTVKGSSLRQRIYTYDARHKGVDFFLFGKTDEQADMDSDLYNTNIWNTDQDLCSMRQHVTDDFLDEFDKGRREYLSGHWPSAIKHLETANEILLQNMVEEGYIEYELNELQNHVLDEEDARLAEQEFRNETEDGPSRRLLAYMRSEGGVAPANWEGYRPLTSK